MKWCIYFVVAVVMVAAFGCDSSTGVPNVWIPDTMDLRLAPEVSQLNGIYRLALGSDYWPGDARRHADSLVGVLGAYGIYVKDLWYPEKPNPFVRCAWIEYGVLVRTTRNDTRILSLGFDTKEPYWCPYQALLHFKVIEP